jgi:hypothetical protein
MHCVYFQLLVQATEPVHSIRHNAYSEAVI